MLVRYYQLGQWEKSRSILHEDSFAHLMFSFPFNSSNLLIMHHGIMEIFYAKKGNTEMQLWGPPSACLRSGKHTHLPY